jgi:hypothetical protein
VNLLNPLPESADSNPLWRSQPLVPFQVSEQQARIEPPSMP